MTTFKPFDMGWTPGLPYGYGLMKIEQRDYVNGSCPAPFCTCSGQQCFVNRTYMGHGGEDWGSQVVFNGFLTNLNVSAVLAVGSYPGGVNASLTLHQNKQMKQRAQCQIFNALYAHIIPRFPGLACMSQMTEAFVGTELQVLV